MAKKMENLNNKICKQCNINKLLIEFPKNGQYIRTICKLCYNTNSKNDRQIDPSKHRLYGKNYRKNNIVNFDRILINKDKILHRIYKYIEIDNNNCHNWLLSCNQKGYGQISIFGKKYRLNRLIYRFMVGTITDDLYVLHKCDNPKCLNPDHLFLGTQDDNMKDMVNKNRQCKGISRNNAKLDDEKIIEIRKLSHSISIKQLAKIFHVSCSTIQQVINGRRWKHIPIGDDNGTN